MFKKKNLTVKRSLDLYDLRFNCATSFLKYLTKSKLASTSFLQVGASRANSCGEVYGKTCALGSKRMSFVQIDVR